MKFKILSLLLAAMILLPGTVSAAYSELDYGTHEISCTLQVNEDAAFAIHTEPGDRLIVNLTVASGGPVDFYLSNTTAYLAYRASVSGIGYVDELYYVREYSRKSSGSISYEYTAFIKNNLVVLIDNTGWTEGGAVPTDVVVVEGPISVHKNVWTWQNIAITALVIAVIVAFMVGVRLPIKKE